MMQLYIIDTSILRASFTLLNQASKRYFYSEKLTYVLIASDFVVQIANFV